MVVFDPSVVSYADLLKIFWEAHDPTQGMRQGNDVGTTYRSAIYTIGDEQALMAALASRDAYERRAEQAGTRQDHHRDRAGAGPSISPRRTTSNIWRRTPTAIAG